MDEWFDRTDETPNDDRPHGVEPSDPGSPSAVLPPRFPPPPGGWDHPQGPGLAPETAFPEQPDTTWGQSESLSTEHPGHPRRTRAVIAIVASLALLGAGIGIGWGLSGNNLGRTAALSTPLTPAPQISQPGRNSTATLNPQAIAQKVNAAVVDITATLESGPLVGSSNTQGPSSKAAGTGMVIGSTGEILTNNHVVEGSTKIQVTFPTTSKSYSAHVIGVSTTGDVALLQIDGSVSGLPTVQLADSSQLEVGQPVVAIGNALGRGGAPAVTSGRITGLRRSITVSNDNGATEHLTNLIQMNASISPGDSGGPLVNAASQVVGLITAASRTRTIDRSSTEGYAIPVDDAISVVNLIRSGHEGGGIIIGQAGFLGVQVSDLDPETAAQLGLSVNSGVLIQGVIVGTPAARIGLSRNSVITSVNGTRISSVEDLGAILHVREPGEHVKVTWVNQTGSHSSDVALAAGPAV